MYARPFIDSLDFAKNGQQVSGELLLAEMPRLADILSNTQGGLSYIVQGGMDKQAIPWLGVRVTGLCQLQCQRCLSVMQYEIKLVTRLLLRDQASLDALEDDEAEFDSVLADKHLDVVSLLEEEILLSLPIAPKHEFGECQAANSQTAAVDETHPFAALAKLKSFNH
ncbi:MAG: YceD family protein [Gallionella sp.]